jgi:transcriptional regulator of acetoin/glycerol metabolism
MTLTDDARELPRNTGNVREMRNPWNGGGAGDDDKVTAAELNPWLETPPEEGEDAGLKGRVARSEIDSIRRALDAADWNVTQAAAGLGIDRTNLHRKMRKYGIARR